MIKSGFNEVAPMEFAPFEVEKSLEQAKPSDVVQLMQIIEHNGKADYTDGRLSEVDERVKRSPVRR